MRFLGVYGLSNDLLVSGFLIVTELRLAFMYVIDTRQIACDLTMYGLYNNLL